MATKAELEQQIERLHILLGIAFGLLPTSRTKLFFERAGELGVKTPGGKK